MKKYYFRQPFATWRNFSVLGVLMILSLLPGGPLFATSAAQPNNQPVVNSIQSAFDPKTGAWDVAWPGRVSQYDLVYQSPPNDPMQGIPLGNGDTGVLFWCEGSRLIAVVNKSDLWDDAAATRFHNWKKEEEDFSTTLRHACRIIFDFKFPIFDIMYLSEFEGRLNLAEASLTLNAESPFGKVGIEAFVDHESGLLFCDLTTALNDNVPIDISMERFGSRTFSHWYSQINRDASIGLGGSEAMADDQGAFLTQKLSSGVFTIGGTVLHHNGLTVAYSQEHSSACLISLQGSGKKEAQLAFSVTSPRSENPLVPLKQTLADADEKGIVSFRTSHNEEWKAIWLRSFMDYGDDYLSNLWHLTMYYANASQGGKYPGRFTNGLWGWSRDVQNWNFYFHWNQQQLYWPLNAAGFHRLVEPYLDYRFNSLTYAKADARDFFNSDGAYISDVTERRGYNSMGELENHTPIAEIALDFWRQYQYTGDEKFLKTKALPFIIEAAKYFESLFVKENDGLYHAVKGTGYEGWIKMKDSLTELVYARALFSVALAGLKAADMDLPQTVRWREIIKNCAPLPVIQAGGASIARQDSGYAFMRGFFRGKTAPTDEILAAGWGIKENKWLTVFSPADAGAANGLKLLDGIFPSVPSSPVFPSNWIGLAQKESRLFSIMKTTILLYAPEITGWDPVPIVLARLGLGHELALDLANFPGRWQIYPNGWGHWGMEGEVNKDAEYYFRTNMVKDVASTTKDAAKIPLPMWPFRHMSMESMSVLATAMNESLLQSHEGVLRIAPAFAEEKSGRFTLHAIGGFIVSGEIKSGSVQWIAIKSLLGNTCRIQIPWPFAELHSNRGGIHRYANNDIAKLKTSAGEILLLVPAGTKKGAWSVVPESPSRNDKVKRHASGKTQLGIPRMF